MFNAHINLTPGSVSAPFIPAKPKRLTRPERAKAAGRCSICFKKPWDCRCKKGIKKGGSLPENAAPEAPSVAQIKKVGAFNAPDPDNLRPASAEEVAKLVE